MSNRRKRGAVTAPLFLLNRELNELYAIILSFYFSISWLHLGYISSKLCTKMVKIQLVLVEPICLENIIDFLFITIRETLILLDKFNEFTNYYNFLHIKKADFYN